MLPNILEPHYVIPKTRGGPEEKWNIRYVRKQVLQNWPVLFDDVIDPEEIARRLNLRGLCSPDAQEAWEALFGTMSDPSIAGFASGMIHPNYEIDYDGRFFARRKEGSPALYNT